MAVIKIIKNLIETTMTISKFKGDDVVIRRLPLMPTGFTFEFKRVQFPLGLAFVISINKSKG